MKKANTKMFYLVELVCVIVGVILTMIMTGEINSTALYLDVPTLLLLLLFTIPIMAASGLWHDFCRAFQFGKKTETHRTLTELKKTLEAVKLFQKQVLFAGCVIAALDMIAIFNFTQGQVTQLNAAVVMIVILYTAILELLLTPLYTETKIHILNYMENEE